MGARIIEKHFTFDKTLPGNDHYHAMDVADLKVFVTNLKKITSLGGSDMKGPIGSEAISRRNARRSIVAKCNVAKGTILTEELLTYKRPAHGISPQYWDDVIGRKASRDIKEDDVLQWRDIE